MSRQPEGRWRAAGWTAPFAFKASLVYTAKPTGASTIAAAWLPVGDSPLDAA